MEGKRGSRHDSVKAGTPQANRSYGIQLNLGEKLQKKMEGYHARKNASHNKDLSLYSSSSSQSSLDNNDYYENFLHKVCCERKKSQTHKATKKEEKSIKEEMTKIKNNNPNQRRSVFVDKRSKNKRQSVPNFVLAPINEEKNSNINTLSILQPQRNMNQILTIKNEESFSINEIKKENKLCLLVEESKIKDDNLSKSNAMKSGVDSQPVLTVNNSNCVLMNKSPAVLYKDMGAFSHHISDKKKGRRQSVIENPPKFGAVSSNIDDYILKSINKKPRLSISPVRMKRDKMMKLLKSKDKEKDSEPWKNTNWGNIPNVPYDKKKSNIESDKEKDKKTDLKEKNVKEKDKDKDNKRAFTLEKQKTPQNEATSIQPTKKKRLLFCCIPIK